MKKLKKKCVRFKRILDVITKVVMVAFILYLIVEFIITIIFKIGKKMHSMISGIIDTNRSKKVEN